MKKDYQKLLAYIQKMESKYGSVMSMNDLESGYMLKLSCPCYKNEYASLNQYEITIIKRYLNDDINVRQLAYYLGRTTNKNADRKAQLYKAGRYKFTDHMNYWEMRKK